MEPDAAQSVARQLEGEHAVHRRRVLQAVGMAVLPFPVAALLLGGELVSVRMATPLVVVGLGALVTIALARRGQIQAGTTLIALVCMAVAADAHVLLGITEMAPVYATVLVALGMTVLSPRAALFQAFWLVLAVMAMRLGRLWTGDDPFTQWLPSTLDSVTLACLLTVLGLVDRRRVDRDRRLLYQAVTALEHQRSELEEAREQAVMANELKSQFLARVSHELRTPLNAILGYGELLQESDEIHEEAREDVDRICVAAKQQLSMVDHLLDLVRVESGQLALQVERVELRALVEPVLDAARGLSRSKGLQVVSEVGPGSVRIDAGRTRQILLNLVSNAARFTESGEIGLSAQVGGDGCVTFVIRDTGIGIRKDRIGRLFQPFVQAERDIEFRYGGAGLGLAITDRLVRAMGGTLQLDSELGRGTTVRVTIPVG